MDHQQRNRVIPRIVGGIIGASSAQAFAPAIQAQPGYQCCGAPR
jgi:hypothetical protein